MHALQRQTNEKLRSLKSISCGEFNHQSLQVKYSITNQIVFDNASLFRFTLCHITLCSASSTPTTLARSLARLLQLAFIHTALSIRITTIFLTNIFSLDNFVLLPSHFLRRCVLSAHSYGKISQFECEQICWEKAVIFIFARLLCENNALNERQKICRSVCNASDEENETLKCTVIENWEKILQNTSKKKQA